MFLELLYSLCPCCSKIQLEGKLLLSLHLTTTGDISVPQAAIFSPQNILRIIVEIIILWPEEFLMLYLTPDEAKYIVIYKGKKRCFIRDTFILCFRKCKIEARSLWWAWYFIYLKDKKITSREMLTWHAFDWTLTSMFSASLTVSYTGMIRSAWKSGIVFYLLFNLMKVKQKVPSSVKGTS